VEPLLPVGWTLNFEMLFYAVFAIAIALGVPRLRFCVLVFLALLLAGQALPPSVPLTFYARPLVFEFVMGVAIAYALIRFGAQRAALGLLATAAGVAIIFAVPWDDSRDRLLHWGLGAALMVLGATWLEPHVRRAPSSRPLAFLGDTSYSLYLVHVFLVPAGVMLLRRLGVQDPVSIFLIVTPTVVAGGILSHLLLEKPMASLFRRLLYPRSPLSYSHVPKTPVE
jgi:peptidoglycan/LPS O-acetylase OafA/YrhL